MFIILFLFSSKNNWNAFYSGAFVKVKMQCCYLPLPTPASLSLLILCPHTKGFPCRCWQSLPTSPTMRQSWPFTAHCRAAGSPLPTSQTGTSRCNRRYNFSVFLLVWWRQQLKCKRYVSENFHQHFSCKQRTAWVVTHQWWPSAIRRVSWYSCHESIQVTARRKYRQRKVVPAITSHLPFF